ncbi:helicase-related protein [Candidatus Margulisiibacteriota bacterium]
MRNFITNSGRGKLKDRLVELIANSQELKFLVAFFYFSGVKELYHGLKDKQDFTLRILVGLNADRLMGRLVEYAGKEEDMSNQEIAHNYLESVKKSINTDELDNPEFYEQIQYFLELIRNGRIIIRKTYKPNHAKIYLFRLNESQVGRRQLFITGSSNLTRAGLVAQQEFNVEISDFGFEDTEKYFDTLWEEAVKITEDDANKAKLLSVIENETHLLNLTPCEAFALVLKTYLDTYKHKEISKSLKQLMVDKGYTPYKYQLDAVKQSLSVIETYGGVLIADVVGLGKTIIACAVAREMNKRGMIICPPGLMGDKKKESGWAKYKEEFGLHDWEIWSSGDLENAAEFAKNHEEIEVVIIDEAHRFRNEDTLDYECLKNVCRGRSVLLLTATPFNNTPKDILSMLELFIVPKKSEITLEEDLKNRFRIFKGEFDRLAYIKKNYRSTDPKKLSKVKGHYQSLFGDDRIDIVKVQGRAHYLSKQIRDVIEPVTIRRNRIDLQNDPDYKEEVKNLSKVEDPQEWYYELTKEQSAFYDKVINTYFGDPDEGGRFKGAIYRPFEYEKKRKIGKLSEKESFQYYSQRNLFDFMRRLLVKRFESSFGAFEQSIKRFYSISNKILDFIDKSGGKYILDRKLIEKISDRDPEEIEKALDEYAAKIKTETSTKSYLPKNYYIYNVNKFDHKDLFMEHIKSDIALFEEIIKELKGLELIKSDPKTRCILKAIKKVLADKPRKGEPKRKIVVFTEYYDTARYLSESFHKEYDGRVLLVAGDLRSSKVEEINKNFDASFKDKKDDYDILLSTDRISEGFNLNRAGIVINYDIPWNPVRVIQRVGRINRISKKVFDSLYITNYFPTEAGATIVKSREIAQHKMFLIHSTLGEDAKIFDVDEEPTAASLYQKIQINPDALESESFYTKAKKQYMQMLNESPEIERRIRGAPARVKVAKKFTEKSLLLFIKKNRLYVRQAYDDKNIMALPIEDAYEKAICEKDEKALSLSEAFWGNYQAAKSFKESLFVPLSEASLEQKALNQLKTILDNPWEEIIPLLPFVRTLREDIAEYGTLPDFTLRRIAYIELGEDRSRYQAALLEEITEIFNELGEDYLEKEKEKRSRAQQEIIIAIENQ